MYWGTVNDYNSIGFYNDNTLVQWFTGNDLGVGHANVYANFFAGAGELFNQVILASTFPALESDNHAYKVAPSTPNPKPVPEPSSTLGLLAFGTFGVSFLLKRKQQQKVLNSVISDR